MLTLKECAERLGVHYMTAYRYVRLGMLGAVKVGAAWQVDEADLEDFLRRRGREDTLDRRSAPWADRLLSRLDAGDEVGAWQVVEAALSAGMNPDGVYLDIIGPAMRRIGDGWQHGSATIADEHRATAIVTRLVGRLSARFRTRGRPRGRVVIGTPPGEQHALAVAMVADLLRGAGFEVVDLGCDLPAESFAEAVLAAQPLIAVAVSVTNPAVLASAAGLIEMVREVADTPIVIGGSAVRDDAHAASLGADAWAADGPAAIDFVVSRLRLKA